MPDPIDTAPFTPCPAPFNLAAYVLDPAAAPAQKTALELWSPNGVDLWSYARLRGTVAAYAAALRALGAAPQDKVLMRIGNTVDFPLVFLACLAADLVPVPTSAALTQEEVDWIAADLKPALCIWDGETVAPGAVETIRSETLRQPVNEAEFAPVLGDPNRLGYVIYTSGSSGKPRAVAHAHRAIWARRMMWHGWYGMGPEDRMLHAGAFNWTYTLGVGLLDPWAMGAVAIIPAAGTPSAALPGLLEQSAATIFAAARVFTVRSSKLDPCPIFRASGTDWPRARLCRTQCAQIGPRGSARRSTKHLGCPNAQPSCQPLRRGKRQAAPRVTRNPGGALRPWMRMARRWRPEVRAGWGSTISIRG